MIQRSDRAGGDRRYRGFVSDAIAVRDEVIGIVERSGPLHRSACGHLYGITACVAQRTRHDNRILDGGSPARPIHRANSRSDRTVVRPRRAHRGENLEWKPEPPLEIVSEV